MYDKKTIVCLFILCLLLIILVNIVYKCIYNKEKYENASGTNASGTNASGTNASGTNWLSDEEILELTDECNWSCGRIRTDASTNGKAECYPEKNGEFSTYQECIKTGCESHINNCVLNSATEWVPNCNGINDEDNCNNSYYFENNMNETNININSQRCRWKPSDDNSNIGICMESNNGTDMLYNKCNLPQCEKNLRVLDDDTISSLDLTKTSCSNDFVNEEFIKDGNKCGEIILNEGEDNEEIIKYSGINKDSYLVNCNSNGGEHENINLSDGQLIQKTLNNDDNICKSDINEKTINEHMCQPIDCEVGLSITEECSEITADRCESFGEKFSIGSTQIGIYHKNRIFEEGEGGEREYKTEWDTMENNYIVPCRLARNNDTLNQCMGATPDENGLIPICQIPDKCKNKDCGQNGMGGIDGEGIGGRRGYCDNETGECICDISNGYSGDNCEISLGRPESRCIPEGGICSVYDNMGPTRGRWWDATNGWGCCKSGDISTDNMGDTIIYGKNVTINFESYEQGISWNQGAGRPGRTFRTEAFWEQIYSEGDQPTCGGVLVTGLSSPDRSNDDVGTCETGWDLRKCITINDREKAEAYLSKFCLEEKSLKSLKPIHQTAIIAIPQETIDPLADGNGNGNKNDLCEPGGSCWDIYSDFAQFRSEKGGDFVGWGDMIGFNKIDSEGQPIIPKEALFCKHISGPNQQVRRCEKCSNMSVRDTPYASTARGFAAQKEMLNWSIDQCSADFPRERQSLWPDPGLGRTAYDSLELCVKNGDPISRCSVTPGGNGSSLGAVNVGACQAAKGNNSNKGINIVEQGPIKTYDTGCRSR